MFNKAQVMRRAWQIYCEKIAFGSPNGPLKRLHWSAALKQAWFEAKRGPQPVARRSEAQKAIQVQITALDNKDRWTHADYRRRDELTAALREAA